MFGGSPYIANTTIIELGEHYHLGNIVLVVPVDFNKRKFHTSAMI